jgi:hypothetical protein
MLLTEVIAPIVLSARPEIAPTVNVLTLNILTPILVGIKDTSNAVSINPQTLSQSLMEPESHSCRTTI